MSRNQNTVIIAIIGLFAVAAVVVAIILSGGSAPSTEAQIDYAQIPQSRTGDGAFVLGFDTAPITVVEFADFTCPHCQEYTDTINTFIRDYVATGKAKFEYRMYAGTGSQYREYAAHIAECADDLSPGGFWPAHDIIFEYGRAGRYEEVGRVIADQLKISYSNLLQCASSANQYDTDVNVGSAAGVQGTPAIMIRMGDGNLSWITIGNQVFNRGGVSLEVLASVVQSAQ